MSKMNLKKVILNFLAFTFCFWSLFGQCGFEDPTMSLGFFPPDLATIDTDGATTIFVAFDAVGFANPNFGQEFKEWAYDWYQYAVANRTWTGNRTQRGWGRGDKGCTGLPLFQGSKDICDISDPPITGADLAVGDYQLDASYCVWAWGNCAGLKNSGLRLSRFSIRCQNCGGPSGCGDVINCT